MHNSYYRNTLPLIGDEIFLTDGGLETTLVFHHNLELPLFAAFDLLTAKHGQDLLRNYYSSYLAFAKENNQSFLLESPTWRASLDWATQLGYSKNELNALNKYAIEFMVELRNEYVSPNTKIVISACVGPRGDGYNPSHCMTALQAQDYHSAQIETFAETDADLVSAMTINYVDEAIGIVHAAQHANKPIVIAFTTETDGKLPTGTSLKEAIETVDNETGGGPIYYMINCAHADHFRDQLEIKSNWVNRIRSIRANASRRSHAELDECEELDRGDPLEFGKSYRELRQHFPQLTVLGGCCGTDIEHIHEIHRQCCRF